MKLEKEEIETLKKAIDILVRKILEEEVKVDISYIRTTGGIFKIDETETTWAGGVVEE